MDPVIATGLITGSVGVVGTVTTAVVSLMTNRKQREADRDRLADEHREADRRVRRDAYVRLLVTIERLDMLTAVYTQPPTLRDYEEWLDAFRGATAEVGLVESEAVRQARAELGRLLDRIGEETRTNVERGAPMIDALGVPYVETREDLHAAGRALSRAMREDLAFAADLSS